MDKDKQPEQNRNRKHATRAVHLPSPCPNRGATASIPNCRFTRYRERGVRWNRSGNALPDRTNRPADVGRSEGAAGKRPDGEGWMDNNLQPAAKGIRFAQRATRAGSVSPVSDSPTSFASGPPAPGSPTPKCRNGCDNTVSVFSSCSWIHWRRQPCICRRFPETAPGAYHTDLPTRQPFLTRPE